MNAIRAVSITVLHTLQVAAAESCFLISSGFQRTAKYLQCLAANIPPVSYYWIEQCYRLNKRVDFKQYLLPAGIDIDGKVVEWYVDNVVFIGMLV